MYNVDLSGTLGTKVSSIVRQGIFNRVENFRPVYGGVQYLAHSSIGGNSRTGNVYLIVANEDYSVITYEP